jgi:hypothetical protein
VSRYMYVVALGSSHVLVRQPVSSSASSLHNDTAASRGMLRFLHSPGCPSSMQIQPSDTDSVLSSTCPQSVHPGASLRGRALARNTPSGRVPWPCALKCADGSGIRLQCCPVGLANCRAVAGISNPFVYAKIRSVSLCFCFLLLCYFPSLRSHSGARYSKCERVEATQHAGARTQVLRPPAPLAPPRQTTLGDCDYPFPDQSHERISGTKTQPRTSLLPKNVLAYVLARSSTLFVASSLDPTCQSVWPETRLKMSSTIRPHNNWRAGRGNGAQLFVRGRHHYPQRAHVGVQSLQAFENPSVVIQKTRRGHRVPASGRACASFEGVEIVPSEVRARCHLVRSRSAHWQWADVASSELSTAGPDCSHVVLRSP